MAQHNAVAEAIDLLKMVPISMPNTTYKVVHNPHMQWMGTRMSPYHVTAAVVGQAFGSHIEFWLPPEGQTTAKLCQQEGEGRL